MSREYKNPPVQEALIELRFSQSMNWDPVVPGLLFAQLSGRFPHREERRSIPPLPPELLTQLPPNIVAQVNSVAGVIFKSDAGNALVQVINPRIVTVNRLKPYLNWTSFRDDIGNVLHALETVLGQTELTLERLGLRYINQIRSQGSDLRGWLGNNLLLRPLLPGSIGGPLDNFRLGCDFFVDVQEDQHCRVQLTGEYSDPNKTEMAAILDIDCSTERARTLSTEATLGWADQAHKTVVHVFEESLSDSLKQTFGSVSEAT
jgi:uncharacterized protein (TIGR04255 family)